MRSSSYFLPSSPTKKDQFVLGPVLYSNTCDDVDSFGSRSLNTFTDRHSHSSDGGPLTVHSRTSSIRTEKSKKSKAKQSRKPSKSSKSKERKCDYNKEDCPIIREERDADYLRRERKQVQIIELAKRAEKNHDKLKEQRTRDQQTAKEVESPMSMEDDSRTRSMAVMKSQLEGIDRRSSLDLKAVRKELEEWKGKTVMSEELAKRVDRVEQRVSVLEKNEDQRKKSMALVEKNWEDFGRLKTQSIALEINQIKNRTGDMYLRRVSSLIFLLDDLLSLEMPKEVASTTAKNLYKLCADLHRLTFHLNHTGDLTRLVDEALTLAEAIAPLFGAKEDFIDSRANTSCSDVSLSSLSVAGGTTDSSMTSSEGRALTLSSSRERRAAPIRSSLRRVGKDPSSVTIPPLSKFDRKYSTRDNLNIEAPSLREKSPNYFSDKEFTNLVESQANCEPGMIKESLAPQVVVQQSQSAPSTNSSVISSPSSISLSVDSESEVSQREETQSRKEKKGSRRRAKESRPRGETKL